MFDYSKNGIFGKVEYYRSAAYIDHFKSVDRIVVAGWHNVNDLYYFDWKKGVKKTSLLIFTLEGRGFLNIDGKKYNLLPGTLAIIPADMPAYYATEKNCHWTFQWIHYCGRHAEAVTTDTVRFGGYVLELKEQENVEIMRYMKQMTDSRLTGLEKLISESEVVDGILHIAVKRAIVPNYGESKKTLSEEIAFGIESASEFSISELSKNYHYSPEHIIRVFRKATGMTPYRYWQICRLKKSCIALESEDIPISEIALSCGFKTSSAFGEQFKKYYGMTPGEYRRTRTGTFIKKQD